MEKFTDVIALFAPIYCPISGKRRYCYAGDREKVESYLNDERAEFLTYKDFRAARDLLGRPLELELWPQGISSGGEIVHLRTQLSDFELFELFDDIKERIL